MATKAPSTKKRGRKPDAGSKSGQIRELLKQGLKPAEIAEKVGCSIPLVYNVKSKESGGAKKRGPGRPKKAAASSASANVSGLDGILSAPLADGLSSLEAALDDIKREYRTRANAAGIPVYDELANAARALRSIASLEQHRRAAKK